MEVLINGCPGFQDLPDLPQGLSTRFTELMGVQVLSAELMGVQVLSGAEFMVTESE